MRNRRSVVLASLRCDLGRQVGLGRTIKADRISEVARAQQIHYEKVTPFEDSSVLDAARTKIGGRWREGDSFLFEFDFGDSWEHRARFWRPR